MVEKAIFLIFRSKSAPIRLHFRGADIVGSIVERPSGGFQAKVRLKGQPAQFRTFATKAEARRWIAEVETDMKRGAFQRDRSAGMTMGDAIDAWAAAKRDDLKHFDVEEARINRLKRFVIDLGTKAGGQPLRGRIVDIGVSRLDVDHIESLIDGLEEAEYAGRTIAQYLSIIQRSWAKAMRRPAAMCPTRAAQNRPKIAGHRTRRLQDDEEARLLAASSHDFRAVIRFALGTCARQSEIAGLTWRDVDLNRRIATLRDTKNGEPRTLPLSPEMHDLLVSLEGRDRDTPIFGMTPEAIKRRMIRATARAGISDLHFHDLRHEAISRLFEHTDLTDMEIMSISGHKSVQMLRTYTHLRAGRLVERVGGARRGVS
ncbi:site-specific integrase [Acidiphilium sp. PM]|uniref:site-specific integrase n=1 Tax=Acidiphilium sp. PM TaxID=1043206 RepID=UPI00021454C7|nr:site-specific integrase [Acidiphilium sp. PM]EGO96283.1 hypothetical protein APM_0899 [Acidiphilium sp. PM]